MRPLPEPALADGMDRYVALVRATPPAADVETMAAELRPCDVFFTVGAGDVTFVGPKLLQRLQTLGLRQ